MSHPRKIPERKEELDFGNTPTHIFTTTMSMHCTKLGVLFMELPGKH